MKKLWFLLYNIFVIHELYLFFSIASLFNQKVKRGFESRKNQNAELIKKIGQLDNSKKIIWFHSSSLGEFEQSKPIIRKLKEEGSVNILVTFFSPSGYENSLNYPYADIIAYLPFDLVKSVKQFISITNPDAVVFIRYDIWPNLIWELSDRKIPMLIVDATMKSDSKRKYPIIKSFHKLLYNRFTKILTISEDDLNNFIDFDIDENKLSVVGDTRFDRVYQKSQLAKEKQLFKDGTFDGKQVLVLGSAWEGDEKIILPAFKKLLKSDKDLVLIIAPHEPNLPHLEKIESHFNGIEETIRYSSINRYQGEKIIIVDSIGILLTLYYYADVVYVGGAFRIEVHNVLEPAVYGTPLLFGPKIQRTQEAKDLVKRQGGKIVRNIEEAYIELKLFFDNHEEKERIGKICLQYVNENIGASDKIIKEINKLLVH